MKKINQLGLALLTAIFITGNQASGAVIYSGILNQQIHSGETLAFTLVNADVPVYFYMNDFLSEDYGRLISFSAGGGNYMNEATFAGVGLTGARWLEKLSYGFPIDGALEYGSGVFYSRQPEDGNPGAVIENGLFSPTTFGTTGYAGFKGGNSSEAMPGYYGWIRLSTGQSPDGSFVATLIDWAYETTPEQAILAGAVPEPSSLSLLLAGGAVFAAARRRKVD